MKFEPGDNVRFIMGKIDWEVAVVVESIPGWKRGHYILKSPMSGRHRTAWESELKPWTPGA